MIEGMAYLEGVVGCQLQSVQTKDLAQDIQIPTNSVIDHDGLTLQVLYACYGRHAGDDEIGTRV